MSNPKAALRYIRNNTRFLWLDLKNANPWEHETKSELRETTFGRIRPALNLLAAEGFLQFQVAAGYRLDSGDILTWQSYDPVVLSITISAMTKELAVLILEISQED